MSLGTVVDITINKGNSSMDNPAPAPTDQSAIPETAVAVVKPAPSTVSVTLVGVGGAGQNIKRAFHEDARVARALAFDTSMSNAHPQESVNIIGSGSGSGSNKHENAAEIKRAVPALSDDELGISDVAIVIYSLAGGSGSTCGPLLVREYARRGARVIAVMIADTSHSVGASNTLMTLKTVNAIASQEGLVIPTVLLTNDNASRRGDVDAQARNIISVLLGILTEPTYEVDRNDRLNWINASKVAGSSIGVKILSLDTPGLKNDPDIVLGTQSPDMVDSLLVLTKAADDEIHVKLPPARLKKTGFYIGKYPQIVGRISSDISSIDKIIDHVEKMQNLAAANTHASVSRLATSSDDNLIM